jgi:hypothetical protein
MCEKIYVMLTVIAVLFVGCSMTPDRVKPDLNHKNGSADVTISEKNRDAASGNFKNIPVQSDILKRSQEQKYTFNRLNYEIRVFRQVTGRLPDSIDELINSGFQLWWPRNLQNDQPAELVEGRYLVLDESDFGKLKYEVLSNPSYPYNLSDLYNCRFQLKNISLDTIAYRDEHKEIWKETIFDFPEKTRTIDENTTRHIDVIWGKKAVYEINNQDTRMLYAMCGNLVSFIHHQTGVLYRDFDRLPESFNDLLDNNCLIIRENFDRFANSLKDSNVDLKWGIDREQNREYIIVKTKDEIYISGCRRFGDKQNADIPGYGIYFDFDYDINNLDISSPIITSDNLKDVVIPEKYLVSVNDVLRK